MTYTYPARHTYHRHRTKQAAHSLMHTQQAHSNTPAGGTHKQALVLAVKETQLSTAHRQGLHTHAGILSTHTGPPHACRHPLHHTHLQQQPH